MQLLKTAWDQHMIAWDHSIKSMSPSIKGLGERTGRFGGEENIRCHTCGKWVETTLAQFSRYDGEPLCAGLC